MTRKVQEILSAAPVCMAASESVSAAAKAILEIPAVRPNR
jgi:hypothetical protein